MKPWDAAATQLESLICASCGGPLVAAMAGASTATCPACGLEAAVPESYREAAALLARDGAEVEVANALWQRLNRWRVPDPVLLLMALTAPLVFFGALASAVTTGSRDVLLLGVFVPGPPLLLLYALAAVWSTKAEELRRVRVQLACRPGPEPQCRQCGARLPQPAHEAFVRCLHCQVDSLIVITSDAKSRLASGIAASEASAMAALRLLVARTQETRFTLWYGPLVLGLFALPPIAHLVWTPGRQFAWWDIMTVIAALVWPLVEIQVPAAATLEIIGRMRGQPVRPPPPPRRFRRAGRNLPNMPDVGDTWQQAADAPGGALLTSLSLGGGMVFGALMLWLIFSPAR